MKFKKFAVGFTVVAILVVSAVVTVVLINTKPETGKSSSRKSVLGVKTMPVKYGDYTVSMSYPGRVAAREILTLTSEVGGKIILADVPLKIGQRFKKGDIIVNIFDEDVRAAHAAQVSLFLNTISTSLPDIKVDFPQEYDKWFSFFSNIDIDKRLPELPKVSSDKEKVYVSAKNILSSYYNLRQREIVLDRYVIIAPFNGIYTSVAKEVGSIATANSEIGKITSTDMLELVVGVSRYDAQKLLIGTNVDILSESGKVYHGKVDRISAFVDPSTQRVNIYVVFTEPGLEIIEGQMLALSMPSMVLSDVVECARETIVGDSLIYTVSNGQLVGKRIEVIATTPANSYIKGVTLKDTLVNESLVSPYAGMMVRKLDMDGVPVEVNN